MRALFFYTAWLVASLAACSQVSTTDSLQKIADASPKDTSKVKTLLDLTKEWINQAEYEKALQSANEALEISRATHFTKGEALGHNLRGTAYRNLGKYNESLAEYLASLRLRESIGDSLGVANAYNNLGLLYWNMTRYDDALSYHSRSLRLRQRLGDSDAVAASHLNLGMTYYKQGLKEAAKHPQYASDYFQSAVFSYQNALAHFERRQALHSMAACYNNLANVYADRALLATGPNEQQQKEKFYALSLESYFKARDAMEKADDKQSVAITLNNIAYIYRETGDDAKASDHAQQSLTLAKEIGAKNEIQEAYSNLAEIAALTHDFEKAFEYHKLYSATKDSILNEESSRQIAEMQTRFETEKKDKELLKKDAETRQASMQRNFFIGGFGLMILLAFFIFRGYRQKKKANIEISHQKHLVEEKQKEILDSIHYARRIQNSLLPNEKYIQRTITRVKKT